MRGKEERLKFKKEKADWQSFESIANSENWVALGDTDVEIYRNNIINSITNISQESIPFKRGDAQVKNNQKYKSVPWWDDELKETKIQRTNIFQLLREEPRMIEKNILKAKYKEIRNHFTSLLRRKKERY